MPSLMAKRMWKTRTMRCMGKSNRCQYHCVFFVLFSTFRWKCVRHILKSERRYQYWTLLFSFVFCVILLSYFMTYCFRFLSAVKLQRRLENNMEDYCDGAQKIVNILTLVKLIRNRLISTGLLILLVKVAKLVTHCYSSDDFFFFCINRKKEKIHIKGGISHIILWLLQTEKNGLSLPYTHSDKFGQTNCRFHVIQANFMLRIRKSTIRYSRKVSSARCCNYRICVVCRREAI